MANELDLHRKFSHTWGIAGHKIFKTTSRPLFGKTWLLTGQQILRGQIFSGPVMGQNIKKKKEEGSTPCQSCRWAYFFIQRSNRTATWWHNVESHYVQRKTNSGFHAPDPYSNNSISLSSDSSADREIRREPTFTGGVWQVWDAVDPCLSPLVLLRSLNVKVTT